MFIDVSGNIVVTFVVDVKIVVREDENVDFFAVVEVLVNGDVVVNCVFDTFEVKIVSAVDVDLISVTLNVDEDFVVIIVEAFLDVVIEDV